MLWEEFFNQVIMLWPRDISQTEDGNMSISKETQEVREPQSATRTRDF